ncbi:MAG: hypothetical protein HC822_21400 [Oscillochloris sp.]|nr:hypothetical protein [Oscillochloris sp.]
MADSPCVLSRDQFARLGMLLLQIRPQDVRAICFLGGALSGAAANRRYEPNVFSLEGDLGDDPFLVIAGPQGVVAVMAVEGVDGFYTRLFSDPDLVDRAALVLSQFSDQNYSLDAICDPEAQRAFVAVIADCLVADPTFAGANLGALMEQERRWLDLAVTIRGAAPAQILQLPALRQLLSECGVTRALAGPIDDELRSLSILMSDGSVAGTLFNNLPPALGAMARTQRIVSMTSADSAALGGELGAWVRGLALTAVPIVFQERVVEMLLATGERPLTAHARALLNGLSSLLGATISQSQVPVLPPPADSYDGDEATGSAPSKGLSLAARLSRGRPAALPSAPNFTPAATNPSLPAVPAAAPAVAEPVTPPAMAQPIRRPASSLAQRTMAISRGGEHTASDLSSLLSHLSDGVVVVNPQGRLVAFSNTGMRMFGLNADARSRSLVESGALCLAPLFTDAITGDLDGPREVELPTGQRAVVEVVSLEGGMWAFVLHTDATRPAVPEVVANSELPVVSDGERNESFLSNFSNIIRVPLRELRELITQVPAAGNLNEQQSRLIGQVVRLNSELTMLVNDLLALGQIRLQATEARVPLRIDLLVEAAVGTQYAEFGRRGQHVTTEIQSGLARVAGSEEGLGRAVAALIDNAIKYSPARPD